MAKVGRYHVAGLLTLAAAALTAVAVPAFALGTSKTASKSKLSGKLYSQTNGLSGNQIVVFDRYADGSLKKAQLVSTGGKGGAQEQPGCSAMCPQLDTDSEVVATPDGSLVFAVNAGSNTISAFRPMTNGLKLVDQVPSEGAFPFSLTTHGKELYVLNTDSRSIAGFTFSSSGMLTPIAGSVQPLTSDAMPGLSRQIGFDQTGKVLVVTLLEPAELDTFVVGAGGAAGPASETPSTATLPFGFAFDKQDQLVLSQAVSMTMPGNTATYSVSTSTGALTPIDTVGSNGAAPCWAVVIPGQRFVFVVNTGDGAPSGATVTTYSLSPSGALTFVGLSPPISGELLKTDEYVTRDGRYLYVIGHQGSHTEGATDSYIDEYKIATNGTLKFIGATPSAGLAVGLDGLAGG
jgi:6-phosphogluconolactonase (cycloisomerase 2 family)